MKPIEISIDYLKSVNYAMFHNSFPICRHIDITNNTGAELNDVEIRIGGEFILKGDNPTYWGIAAGETFRTTEVRIVPDAARLAALTERVMSSFSVSVIVNEQKLAEEFFEIEFLPFDYWLGTNVMPQTLVSFITPNHPAIANAVVDTAAVMKKLTGSSMLKAYQTGNPNNVRQTVGAVFAALHARGIIYRSAPASYEEVGQRITLPDKVIESKTGNCIELTLLMASVLEAAGINSIIILQQGHAYLGVWLIDDCYTSCVCDDAAFIEKKCSQGISEMMVIECTQIAVESASFEQAIRIAEKNLADHDKFEMFIDVKRCRLERVQPLPSHISPDSAGDVRTKGVEHEECAVNVVEHDRYDLSRISPANKELTKFDIWERKLLDFSLRNSLLNLSLRHRAVQFISFDIDRLEDHLHEGEEYCIAAKPESADSVAADSRPVRSKLHEDLRELITADMTHHLLHTYHKEDETRAVLKNIYRAARNTIEETGANSLFMAIGVMRWYESPQHETPRYAPVLLLPVEMVYKKGNYYVRTRDEEISLNITLTEFMRQNFNITIDGLDPLPRDSNGVDVALIFAIIRDALKEQKRWDIEEECVLGTFSFNKFLMWNDIHAHHEELSKNFIVKSLIENRPVVQPQDEAIDLTEADATLPPDATALPVAVDSSQMAAVIEAAKGHSFILYGPPGTGKSQTITNLIANALYHGKRVLFMAEKMAALSVVQSRLEKIGLGPFCLELHSNKTTKRHVLQQLDRSLKAVRIMSPNDFGSTADKLFEERRQLIEYMNALHTPDATDGLSLYDCILRYQSVADAPRVDFRFTPELDKLLADEGIERIEELLGDRLETVVKLVGQPSRHELKGLKLTREMLMDKDRTAAGMRADAQLLNEAAGQAGELAGTDELRQRLTAEYTADILNENAEELRSERDAARSKWLLPRLLAKRRFRKRLQRFKSSLTEEEIDPLIAMLADYRRKHDTISRVRQIMSQHFDSHTAPDIAPDAADMATAAATLGRWADNQQKMRDWLHWSEYSDLLRANGLGGPVSELEEREYAPATLRRAFLKALFRHKAEEKIGHSELLATFEGMIFDEKVAAYKRLAERFRLLVRKELYARLCSRIPTVTESASAGSELGLLSRNISNGGRGLSIHDLFSQIPTLLPRLCPCMLMSPLSAARFVAPEQEKFDIVIFDEASQMPTSEAVGAIARGKSLIVVGDPKQMPPTSFFTSTNVDEDEASIDDMESILEDCRTLQLPSLQLSWHYRSRHESLIAFSNNEYYDGSLITFPSIDDKRTRVHHIHVDGYYDKSNSRCNRAEAEAIVAEIERRLRDEELRKNSIGVIAFNVMQQGLIEDLLQSLLDKDKTLHDAAAEMYEPIFIKNLENVQGDERDTILFSIGYGPDRNGKVSMNFGPLNNAGGERRLNVAVSRARCEMYVYSTLRSSDIDLRRSKARGVEGLKHFLQYAESQSLPGVAQTSGRRRDTIVAEQIAAELRKKGHTVVTNVGRSQFKVDVAVCDDNDPGTYRLGLLLDGDGYRSTHTTQDREVVQPSVLAALGWQTMRVWSVDWFNNKERVLSRIEERLEAPDGDESANPGASPETFDPQEEKGFFVRPQKHTRKYRSYLIKPRTAQARTDEELAEKIIAIEQPITFSLLCRRVSALRDSGRVNAALQNSLKEVIAARFYVDDSNAIWLTADACDAYESYRPDSGRAIADIPAKELANAICDTLAEQDSITEDSLTLLTSKKLGFTCRGRIIDSTLRNVLQTLVNAGKVVATGNYLRLSDRDTN